VLLLLLELLEHLDDVAVVLQLLVQGVGQHQTFP
jgi:hypothetical protein